MGPPPDGAPLLVIGGPPRAKAARFQVRTAFYDWRGGIVPAHADGPDAGTIGTIPLSPMLAAALAVNEALLYLSGELPSAGHRLMGLDLWNLSPGEGWLAADGDAPELRYLPTKLWLIGLGHLGQAYLWGLGLLPYADSACRMMMSSRRRPRARRYSRTGR